MNKRINIKKLEPIRGFKDERRESQNFIEGRTKREFEYLELCSHHRKLN